VLETLVREAEALVPGGICSLLLLDASAQQRTHLVAPGLPARFRAVFEGLPRGAEMPASARAASGAQRVLVNDLEADADWQPYLSLVRE